MSKADAWFYTGIVGMALSTVLTIDTVRNIKSIKSTLPQEYVQAAQALNDANRSMILNFEKKESPHYQAKLAHLETSRSNYLQVVAQPAIRTQVEQGMQHGWQGARNLGASMALSAIFGAFAINGYRMKIREQQTSLSERE